MGEGDVGRTGEGCYANVGGAASPHDQLLVRLDWASTGVLDHPKLLSTMVISCSNTVSVMAMANINSRLDEVLMWLLNYPWNDLSSS